MSFCLEYRDESTFGSITVRFLCRITPIQNRLFQNISDSRVRIWIPLLTGRTRGWLNPVVATPDTSTLGPKAICPLSRHDGPAFGARASCPRTTCDPSIPDPRAYCFPCIGYNCCPRTVGFLEMRSEKWIVSTIMDGFGPDNENRVTMGSRLLQCMSF